MLQCRTRTQQNTCTHCYKDRLAASHRSGCVCTICVLCQSGRTTALIFGKCITYVLFSPHSTPLNVNVFCDAHYYSCLGAKHPKGTHVAALTWSVLCCQTNEPVVQEHDCFCDFRLQAARQGGLSGFVGRMNVGIPNRRPAQPTQNAAATRPRSPETKANTRARSPALGKASAIPSGTRPSVASSNVSTGVAGLAGASLEQMTARALFGKVRNLCICSRATGAGAKGQQPNVRRVHSSTVEDCIFALRHGLWSTQLSTKQKRKLWLRNFLFLSPEAMLLHRQFTRILRFPQMFGMCCCYILGPTQHVEVIS